ncbi:hypothetical protein Thal_0475 [Thermocrinis albus DSM 14484]|uniref:Flagellar protein FlgJ N-terminal domain-containing protein n=1 Tax=Thermocrinis albus (strain DSM 14484 / JCM 11386 / HI 11/12) TaxID=638303 RepID=D3SPM2_THEAH|nr:hypothetical protein [Thermocrinis albus]ADC89109.1 hypothetical protein Thal_0475 [Thermocrinis albus DSM 14484]
MKIYSVPPYTYVETTGRDIKTLAKDLESLLLKEVLKLGFRPVLEGKSFTTQLYYDTLMEALSKKLVEAGGVGVADYLVKVVEKWEGLTR